MKPPLTIGFNVPFHEAIAAAQLRGVVLPDVYYGELQGLARQLAFSIAGIASLDQLQAVKDSLSDYMDKGGSFNAWKKQSAQLNLELPAHRLDNIWRTNLQGNYMRGKWEQFQRNADTRPYLLYDAINDSRVRPSHLAHDGTIRRVNDAFWKTHSPPLGYRCRCSLISLTEEQAQARSRPNPDGEGTGLYKTPQLEGGIPAEPDKGWDYNPFEDRMQWAEKALERFDPKLRAVGEKYLNPPSWTMIKGNSATLDEMKRLGEERLNDLLDTELPDHVASTVAGWTPTPGATLREAMTKNMALPDTVMQWLRETTLQRAGQVRAMGGVKPALYQKSGLGVQLMRRVASKLPDEWVSHANQYPVHVAVSKARGFFSTGHWIPSKNELRRFIQTSQGSTAEHEFMHHIQHADSNLDALFAEEHRRRTLNDPVESLYPNDPKHKKEVGKRDSYVDVYQGREYSGKPLEVITMAFQAMLGGDKRADGYLHGTLYYDQDMLKLILGTLFHYSP